MWKKRRLILFIPLIVLFRGCIPALFGEPTEDCFLSIINDSDRSVLVYYETEYPRDSTAKRKHYETYRREWGEEFATQFWSISISPKSEFIWSEGTEKRFSWLECFYGSEAGYVSIFVYDTIIDEDTLMVRYDITEQDFNNLGRCLYYPPTEAMRNVHMWPPYETFTKME